MCYRVACEGDYYTYTHVAIYSTYFQLILGCIPPRKLQFYWNQQEYSFSQLTLLFIAYVEQWLKHRYSERNNGVV